MGATYYQRKDRGRRGRKSWVVVVRSQGERQLQIVHAEQDAKALVQMIHKQELAGVNVMAAIRQARAQAAPSPEPVQFPTLRGALPAWIERQERAGEIRVSTGMAYRSRLATWVYPHPLPDGRLLGDVAVNHVTRELLGAVIRRVREAGRSLAIVEGIRNPLRGYYADAIETKALAGPNPAGDLRHFVGKRAHRKARERAAVFFAQEEGPQLVASARALFPRWHVFILTGLLGGLRWGESAALRASDIDFRRGRIRVERTWSDKAGRLEAPKDHEGALRQGEPRAAHGPPRSARGSGAGGPGAGLERGATGPGVPEQGRPDHAVQQLPRGRVAASDRQGRSALSEVPFHAPHVRHVAAIGRRGSPVGTAAARPRLDRANR